MKDNLYMRLIQAGRDAIVVADVDGRIIIFNRASEELFGYSANEVVGKEVAILMPEEYRKRHSEGLKRFISTGIPKVMGQILELEGLTKEGRRFPIELSLSFIKDEAHIFIAIIRDIAVRKQIESELKKRLEDINETHRQLKEMQAQLVQSEKMAIVGQLATGVAHEINNPISFILSNLDVLSKYSSDITQVIKNNKSDIDVDFLIQDLGKIVSELQEGALRIKRIVQDLRTFSHVDDTQLTLIDINSCLDSTLNIIANELKYKAEVIKEYGDIPKIWCYPMQLNQVFLNILVNALQAIEKYGKIWIRTYCDIGKISIEVQDTGCGMPDEIIDRIFEPFFTTKGVGKGTGLGLSIAYNIVKQHNGEIKVKSRVGEGSAFTIILPVEGIKA